MARPTEGSEPRAVERPTVIEVTVGSITGAPTEAIVNAANSELWMGGGVAGAIKSEGGESIEREAMAQGPIEPGQAVTTGAGRLPEPIRSVIHAATMGPDLRTSAELIASATRSALVCAAEVGARSVALPAMGTGVGGFALEQAARLMVGEAKAFAVRDRRLERIVFVVRDDRAKAAFQKALSS
ncbi:MAG: macro domain-containing protein [Chloroflexota bacterium]|nr:macro domain-containing protein [Chloroflexota bacterium]